MAEEEETGSKFEEELARLRSDNPRDEIFLGNCNLGDAETIILANALMNNRSVRSVFLQDNQIRGAGATALGEAFASMPNLGLINLEENPMGAEGVAALRDAILAGKPKNLGNVYLDEDGQDRQLNEFLAANREAALSCYHKIHTYNYEEQTPNVWSEAYDRLPLMIDVGCEYESSIGSGTNYLGVKDHTVGRFRSFVDNTLPKLEIGSRTTYEDLTQEDYRGNTPLDNPLVRRQLPTWVAGMNARGESVRGHDLLTADKKPTPLFDAFIYSVALPSLFVAENWKGAPKAELSAVIAAMPEDAAAQIPNRHALLASLRSTPPRGRG